MGREFLKRESDSAEQRVEERRKRDRIEQLQQSRQEGKSGIAAELKASMSEGSLLGRTGSKIRPSSKTSAGSKQRSQPNLHTGGGDHPPMREVAVLYYNDVHRTVRILQAKEALAQMIDPTGTPASKLPRAFWQDVGILQAPVRSLLLHGNARYVTYTYTAEKAGATKPHAQVPVAGRRSGSVPFVDYQKGAEAHRVAQVPDKLNRAMKLLRPGQIGYNLEVVSGQFEFVWDEA